jgi:hypothetical protein
MSKECTFIEKYWKIKLYYDHDNTLRVFSVINNISMLVNIFLQNSKLIRFC